MRHQVLGGEEFVTDKQRLRQHIVERSEKMQVGSGSNKQKFHHQLIQQQRRKWGDWSECSKDCLRTRHRRNCDDLIQVQNSTASNGLISSKSNSISVTGGSASKRQASGSSGRVLGGTNEDEEDLLLKAGESANNEDEDYADIGGDEEDEIDSCEKVDASKTTEQIPCTGGLCPLSSNQLGLAEQPVFIPPTSGKNRNQKSRDEVIAPGRHLRPTNHNGVEQQGNSLLANDENEYSITRERSRDNLASRLSDKQRHQHNKQLIRLHSQNSQASGQKFQARNGSTDSSVGQTIINTNGTFEGGDLTLLDSFTLPTSIPNNGATTTTISTANNNTSSSDSAISSVWTKTMWPQLPLSGVSSSNQQLNFSQPATLIQWTILIGSLLSIVLLILLILRKLFISTFPSYQWMLAKQTLKNSSKLNQTAAASLDCCQAASAAAIHHQTRHLSTSGTLTNSSAANIISPCVAVTTASAPRSSPGSLFAGLKTSNKHHHHIHYQQAPPIPPHHMCYAWRRQQQQPPSLDIEAVNSGNGQKHRLANVATAHRYIVDSTGNHILNSSLGANFNTDIYDLPASFAHEPTNPMIDSTSTSGYDALRTTISNHNNSNNVDYESQSVISASYNYGNPALNVVEHDHRRQQLSAAEKGFHLPHNYLPQPQSSSFNQMPAKQHSKQGQVEFIENELDPSIGEMNNYQHQQTATTTFNETKHRSPKVPSRQSRFDQTKFGRDLADNKSASSSSTISGNSGSGSNCESTSSPSIQSTTAQMLSNAASCSFEQTLDQINNELPLSPPSCANENSNSNNNTSLSSIPANSTGLNNINSRARIGIGNTNKLAFVSAVQSQPSSPMFANQFTNRTGSGKLKQRTSHSHATKLMSSTSRLNPHEPDCNQLDDQQEDEEQQLHQQSEPPIEQYRRHKSSTSHCHPNTMDQNQAIIRDSTLDGKTQAHDENRKEHCDTEEDRHHYEEISNHSQAI